MFRKYTLNDLKLISLYIEKDYSIYYISKLLDIDEEDLECGIEYFNLKFITTIKVPSIFYIVPIVYLNTIFIGMYVYIDLLNNNL